MKGENKITIAAIDNEENYTEKNLTVEYESTSTQLTTQFSIQGKYYALIIGINEYQDPNLSNLDYPVKDAESLRNILETRYLFDEENIIFLVNATRSEINNALDILARKITREDNLLIFYAGHGWWDEKADIGYWLPKDAKRE